MLLLKIKKNYYFKNDIFVIILSLINTFFCGCVIARRQFILLINYHFGKNLDNECFKVSKNS